MPCIRNILLDRDGTIIVDKHYLSDPAGIELLRGAAEGLQRMSEAGMRLFVLTNQSGIGRGYFSEEDFFACTDRLDEVVDEFGVYFEDTLFCPHAPDEDCTCRKPLTGMWDELVESYDLKPEETIMIGDKRADVSLGLNAEFAASILVATGKGAGEAEKLGLPPLNEDIVEPDTRQEGWPHCVASDLEAAADWIVNSFDLPAGEKADEELSELFPVSTFSERDDDERDIDDPFFQTEGD